MEYGYWQPYYDIETQLDVFSKPLNNISIFESPSCQSRGELIGNLGHIYELLQWFLTF